MVLGRDVVNREGRRLLPVNIELTQKEIRILKMWGINEIIIQNAPADDSQNSPEENKKNDEKAVKTITAFFGNNDLNLPVVKEAYDICISRFAKDQFKSSGVFNEELSRTALTSDRIEPVKEIEQLLKNDLKLPALPTIFSEINEAAKSPKCSGKDIADIVSKDPSLSATLLKIVNSAHYGLSKKVESLHYAAMALGTRQVSSLALGITVINYFKGISDQSVNMQSFWRHSVACGIAARMLATQVKGTVPERVFIGGLLHDIGWLIFLKFYPEECNLVFNKARLLGLNLHQVEPKYFGMNHARFGSLLAKNWQFSDNISSLIHYHHNRFKTAPPKEVAIVYFSNWLVNVMGMGFAEEKMLSRLDMNAWESLGLPETALAAITKQIDRQLVEVIKFFYE